MSNFQRFSVNLNNFIRSLTQSPVKQQKEIVSIEKLIELWKIPRLEIHLSRGIMPIKCKLKWLFYNMRLIPLTGCVRHNLNNQESWFGIILHWRYLVTTPHQTANCVNYYGNKKSCAKWKLTCYVDAWDSHVVFNFWLFFITKRQLFYIPFCQTCLFYLHMVRTCLEVHSTQIDTCVFYL